MFACGEPYNKAFRACKGPNRGLIRRDKDGAKVAVPQRLAAQSGGAVPCSGRGDHNSVADAFVRGLAAKSTESAPNLVAAGFHGVYAMPAVQTDLMKAVPSIVPSDIPAMSDDECLHRLAQAVQEHDSEHLDEVARLIGRLAVTIE
jgi:hypothetical protein